ncbi:unnamed protein product [Euphydryas editha]|uniref:Calcitonin receptor n=1 Tax=Euphydryas editha TaxID=104508 RepID=A0AAU9V1C7_EUPED|nr:unnamed protein product [Euphydryas editha]
MMCNLNKLLIVAFFTWISYGIQVECYIKDSFCPANFDSNEWHQYQRNPRVAHHTNDQLNCEKPDIYICEEPPNAISTNRGKVCNYRNVWYHEQVFKWVAGRGCLFYTPDFLYVGGKNPINLNAACVYGNMFAPCLEIVKEDGTCGCFPFDPSFEEVAVTVRKALIPSAQRRWENCFYAASDCCSHFMDGNTDGNGQCVPTFDGWSCWGAAQNGTVAENVCPDFAYSNSGPSCYHYSTKECYSNGTWEQRTEYGSCSVTPRLLSRYRYHISMLAFSTAACLPAICIFFIYKRLRVIRVALHRNLLIAIAVRNILVIVSRSEIYIDELTSIDDTAMSVHGIACRVLAVAERIAGNAVFVCMLVEGIYLHRLIVAVFKQKLNIFWLYGIGAVIAIIPVVAWATVMALHNDHSCWVVYTVNHIQWLLDGPRIIILVLNTILFVDVLRVLLTKLRNSENANQLSTAKATLFLMPLFGTQFIFTAIRPDTTNCLYEQVYYFVAYTIEGLQGLIVSLLYCYINKEVHALIRATYRKTENAVVSHIRGSNYPRMSIDPQSDRRHTYSTGLHSQNTDYTKNRYSTIPPKLHVAEIISIQASERLAEILEPVYETIDNSIVNEGYDYLERSDNDSGYMPRNSKVEEYYGFTNASSVSIGCQDWLRCASPPESIYNNSMTASDATNKDKTVKIQLTNDRDTLVDQKQQEDISGINDYKNSIEPSSNNDNVKAINHDGNSVPEKVTDEELKNCNDKTMLDEIMQYMITKGSKDVKLKPEVLSPNRPDGEKIIFLDE